MPTILFLLILVLWLHAAGKGLLDRLVPSLDPLERLAAAPGIGLGALYLLGFAAYGIALPFAPLLLILLAATIAWWLFAGAPVRDLFGSKEWTLLAGLAAACLWLFALQGVLPIYDGGRWAGDWFEHYQRSLFFLERWPLDTKFAGNFDLAARPPAFNIITAFIASILGREFWKHQLLCSVLNLLPLLPAFLFVRHFFPRLPRLLTFAPLAMLLLNPSFVRNAAYPWTRGLTNYYILLALFFYIRSEYGKRHPPAALSLLFMTMGALVHYSALVFLVPLCVHYGIVSLRFRRGLKSFLLTGAACLALFGTWSLWSAWRFAEGTVTATSTFKIMASLDLAGFLRKDLLNLYHSLVPSALFTNHFLSLPTPLHYGVMIFYSNILWGCLTLGLTVGLIATAVRTVRTGSIRPSRPFYTFWLPYAVLSAYLGILTCPDIGLYGNIHINLQPWLLLSVILGSALLLQTSGPLVFGTVCLILAAENSLFHYFHIASPGYADALAGRFPANAASSYNLTLKTTNGLQFWADLHPRWIPALKIAFWSGLAGLWGLWVYAGILGRRSRDASGTAGADSRPGSD